MRLSVVTIIVIVLAIIVSKPLADFMRQAGVPINP